MCGVIGAFMHSPVNQTLLDGLTVLQHRGQDAAGIATFDNKQNHLRKNNGLVRDVFQTRHVLKLKGNIGIGHIRYLTAGCHHSKEAQPFYINHPYGISLVHNGNLINTKELKHDLYLRSLRHINTNSDSEVLLNVLANELYKLDLDENDIFKAVTNIHDQCKGAYAVIALINHNGLLAFRDPYGIRPLCFGKRFTNGKPEYMIASESVALDAFGFTLVRDVAPGEAIFIDLDGNFYSQQCANKYILSPCIFEYIYLARPDSIIDGTSVYQSRLRMGHYLADKIMDEWRDIDIDVVIPVPETSRTVALDLANRINVPYREGLIKNRYIPRTFIMPGQEIRKKSVRQKLNPVEHEFRNKNVLLVDDSIVRGTTSQQIVQMVRDVGANKVYFASAAPEIRYPNYYGIHIPTVNELIAHDKDVDEICQVIGTDKLIFQNIDDLKHAVKHGNNNLYHFDCSCFDGKYITDNLLI